MSKINLIPEIRQQKLQVQKMNTLATTSALAIAIVLGISIFLIAAYAGVMTAQKKDIEKKITEAEDRLEVLEELEANVINLEQGMKNIQTIVDGSKDWNNLFASLEKNTPDDIQLLSLQVSGGQMQLSLKGKEVKSIDRFIEAFANAKNTASENLFSNVTVAGYSKDEKGKVSFQASLAINEEAIW